MIDKLGNANGFLSGITLYPQLIQSAISKSTEGLSMITFFLILANSVIWIAYASHRKLPALLISSALNALSSACIVILILAYS